MSSLIFIVNVDDHDGRLINRYMYDIIAYAPKRVMSMYSEYAKHGHLCTCQFIFILGDGPFFILYIYVYIFSLALQSLFLLFSLPSYIRSTGHKSSLLSFLSRSKTIRPRNERQKKKIMSSTTSASSSSPTCNGNIYVLPTQDSACALPNKDNATDIMSKCCSPASVTHYSDDCGIYCLAQEQSLGDLLDCLTDNGARNGDVFCNDQLNATATADVTASATKTGGDGDATSSSTDSAGSVGVGVSKGGLGVVGVVLGAVVMGAF